MKKLGIFATTIFLTILAAAIYGIINDEIAFIISPEYFTKFKLLKLHLNSVSADDLQGSVAIAGFLGSWWIGLIVGVIIGAMGMIYTQYDNMRIANAIAVTLVFCTTTLSGFIGYAFGRFYLANKGADWFIPEEVVDKSSFITVGSIYDFSLVGVAIGILLAIVYMVRNKAILAREARRV